MTAPAHESAGSGSAPRPATPDLTPPPAPPRTGPTPRHPAPASTSASPTARHLWTRTRGLLIAAVVLLAAAITLATLRSDAQHGRLDPRATDPLGSRAVAELLADHGVSTRVVTTLDAARAAAGADTTLLVANPDLLTRNQQVRLHRATGPSGGRTVLVAPGPPSVNGLTPEVTADPTPSAHTTLSPHCTLPAARRAGAADTGGIRYVSATAADACYPSEGLPTLLRLPTATGDTVLVGSPDLLFNDRLDRQGNASLALQLLGSRPHLVWYLPSLSDEATDTGSRSFFDLIPSGWRWAALQLSVAAVLAALWRARRLGPLVSERLPVVVRASETTEGRARLYRKADARERAAQALRAATRDRLAPLVGTPPARAHTPEALVPALSARLQPPHGHRGPATPARDPHALLFGPPPGDDAALIALADHLDALEREVRDS